MYIDIESATSHLGIASECIPANTGKTPVIRYMSICVFANIYSNIHSIPTMKLRKAGSEFLVAKTPIIRKMRICVFANMSSFVHANYVYECLRIPFSAAWLCYNMCKENLYAWRKKQNAESLKYYE